MDNRFYLFSFGYSREELTVRQIIDGESYRFDYVGPDYGSTDESENSTDSGNDQDTDDDVLNINF